MFNDYFHKAPTDLQIPGHRWLDTVCLSARMTAHPWRRGPLNSQTSQVPPCRHPLCVCRCQPRPVILRGERVCGSPVSTHTSTRHSSPRAHPSRPSRSPGSRHRGQPRSQPLSADPGLDAPTLCTPSRHSARGDAAGVDAATFRPLLPPDIGSAMKSLVDIICSCCDLVDNWT